MTSWSGSGVSLVTRRWSRPPPQSEGSVQAGVGEQSVVEYDRRGKAVKVTRSMVNMVQEIAGFPTE